MAADRQSPEAFWQAVEEEVGEEIRLRCLVQYLDGNLDRPRDSWALFFVTEQAAYYRSLPFQGWQDRLKSLFGVGLESQREPTEQTRVPLIDVVDVVVDKPETTWQRLLRPYPKERVVIRTATKWMSLAPDGDVEEIAASLKSP